MKNKLFIYTNLALGKLKFRFSIIAMFLFLAVINTNLSADSISVKILKDPSTFIKKAEDLSKSTNTIESDFVQKKHLSFLSEDVTTKGKFYFRKEKFLRWEYTSPFKYVMVMNNDKFYIKDDKKVSVFDVKSNQMFSEVNDIIIACLNGNVLKDNNKFKISFFETNNMYLVKLFPLSEKMEEYLQMIEIYFNKSDFSLSELRMIEKTGDYTNISFRNKKMNLDIPDEKFIIK